MKHKDRFYATIYNAPVERPASWLGLPAANALDNLLKYFGAKSIDELKQTIDDDIYPILVPYDCPPANHISYALRFAKVEKAERNLNDAGFFEDFNDPSDIDKFDWPDPEKGLDLEEAKRRARSIDEEYARVGLMWSCHFQNACAAFGMEKALVVMMINPEMYKAVIERITKFYLRANELFYEATKGYLDAVLIGNDFGGQQNLMVSPDSLREFVFPGTKMLIDQAKSYGLKVIHHSCGSIFPIIDDLIGLGVDVIHPVQALAKDMDAANLKKHFGGKVAFCGGVDAQHLLVNGTPAQVARKVQELKEIFPTGLVISPSHEAILPDVPPENIKALFDSVKK
jgi:uroporphyrinogen decarboxylase